MIEQIQEVQQPTQPVPQVPVEPKKKSGLKIVVILLIVILLIGTGFVYAKKFLSKPKACTSEAQVCPDGSSVGRTGPNCEFAPCPSQTPSTIPTPDENTSKKTVSVDEKSYMEDTSVSGQKRYVSPKLGISFLFAEQIPDVGQKVLVKEVENKIYVYGDNMQYDSGQSIEVFQKNREQSLEEAIQEKIMKGYSSDKCTITTENPFSTYPVNYEIANIEVIGNYDDLGKLEEMRKSCPSYTQSNGMSYFLGDKNHPDKFVFFSIGQYSINSTPSGNNGWEETIKFLD